MLFVQATCRPPPPTRASFASCSPNDSRATQLSLEGAGQLAWYARAYSPAHAAECAGVSARVVVGWIIETGIRMGLVSARYMSFFSMEVAIPSLADFPLQTAG